VADQLRPKLPKLAAFMDEAEADVLAYMDFPATHRTKLHSTNPLERLTGEVKRRTDVIGIFPNEEAVVRLVGAILLEQNHEWSVQRGRYMTLETIVPLMIPSSACPPWQSERPGQALPEIVMEPWLLHHDLRHDPAPRSRRGICAPERCLHLSRTEPCPVPFSSIVTTSSSRTPGRNHFWNWPENAPITNAVPGSGPPIPGRLP
jgi:Transposase, Mutator family